MIVNGVRCAEATKIVVNLIVKEHISLFFERIFEKEFRMKKNVSDFVKDGALGALVVGIGFVAITFVVALIIHGGMQSLLNGGVKMLTYGAFPLAGGTLGFVGGGVRGHALRERERLRIGYDESDKIVRELQGEVKAVKTKCEDLKTENEVLKEQYKDVDSAKDRLRLENQRLMKERVEKRRAARTESLTSSEGSEDGALSDDDSNFTSSPSFSRENTLRRRTVWTKSPSPSKDSKDSEGGISSDDEVDSVEENGSTLGLGGQ